MRKTTNGSAAGWVTRMRCFLLVVSFGVSLVGEAYAKAYDNVGGAEWPLWDGNESVADYAKRAGIKDVQMELDLGSNVVMKLTLIPAGKYIRGCDPEQVVINEGVRRVIREADKGCQNMLMWSPKSEVTITQPFYMGVSAVTLEQYGQVMGTTAAQEAEKYARESANRHREDISEITVRDPMKFGWVQAALFCKKLSVTTGRKVWLPTEAQSEYSIPLIYPHVKHIKAKYCRGGEWIQDNFTHNFFGAPTVDPAGPAYSPAGLAGNHTGMSYFDPRQVGEDGARKPFHNGWHGWGGPGLFRVAVAVKASLGQAQEARDGNPAKAAAVTGPSAAGPADPKVRVPPGCRAAPGTQAEPYTKTGWAQAIVHEATGMEMVYIPAGNFLMGTSPEEESYPYLTCMSHSTWTQHPVTLTKGFYLGRTEVTQAQWERVMGTTPSHFAGRVTEEDGLRRHGLCIAQHDAGPEAPVEMVPWTDCQTFCQKAGGGLRLPTEAEWEYACRAGTTDPYAGDLDDMGWHLGNSGGTTHSVGARKPNAWGLYDMHGNVWEWCQDYFETSGAIWGCYYHDPDYAVRDPAGPAIATDQDQRRVIRGGGWGDYGAHCRSAIRNGVSERATSVAVGCRFAITATTAAVNRPEPVPARLREDAPAWHGSNRQTTCREKSGEVPVVVQETAQGTLPSPARSASLADRAGMTGAELKAGVEFLTSQKPEERGVGAPGSVRVAAFIAERFREAGLNPGGDKGTWYQDFKNPSSDGACATLSARNVIGVLPGKDPALRGEYILVAARYDCFPRQKGNPGPTDPGADDNAAAVSLLMEIVRGFRNAEFRPDRTLLFIAFDAESMGKAGSLFYCRHPVVPLEKTAYLLNLDMMGRNHGTSIASVRRSRLPKAVAELLDRAAEAEGWTVAEESEQHLSAAYHSHFYRSRVITDCLLGGTIQNPPAERRTSDAAEKADYVWLEKAARVTFRFLEGLSGLRFEFADTPCGRVSFAAGEVGLLKIGAASWATETKAGDPVFRLSTVRTGPKSRVEMRVGEGNGILVAENSSIMVDGGPATGGVMVQMEYPQKGAEVRCTLGGLKGETRVVKAELWTATIVEVRAEEGDADFVIRYRPSGDRSNFSVTVIKGGVNVTSRMRRSVLAQTAAQSQQKVEVSIEGVVAPAVNVPPAEIAKSLEAFRDPAGD